MWNSSETFEKLEIGLREQIFLKAKYLFFKNLEFQ